MKDMRQMQRGSSVARRRNRRISASGVPTMDMLDGVGRAVISCPIPVLGGTSDSFAYFPPANETDTLVSNTEGAFSQLVPSSAAAWPSKLDQKANFQQDLVDVLEDEDYPDKATDGDVVVKHAGVRVQISSAGHLVIDSEQMVRLQLTGGKPFRVSVKGTDTTEYLLLAGPTVDAINALATKIDDLNTRMMSVFAALAAEVPSTIAAGLVATKGVINGLTTGVPYTSAPQAVVEDVSASAFVVSSETVADAIYKYAGD